MKKEKNNKEPYQFAYKLQYPFLKAAFFFWLNPKIINKEYIPKEGPIIICCNHLHVLDQMGPVFSTKRMLHYMAKKEYFDGKFAWFFKINGVIPVDRKIHDSDAKSRAMDVLNNNLALGIFPEGTRNQISSKKEHLNELYSYYKDTYTLKQFTKIMKNNQVMLSQIQVLKQLLKDKKIIEDEYKEYILNPKKYLKTLISKEEYEQSLLLPLKFGAVSMASKTGAVIVPCTISGKYGFRKKTTYTFLKPIKVEKGEDLEKANERLTNTLTKELAKHF